MTRSLTYAELASILGITPDSANKLARRKRWPRTKGNDGKTRVSVPEDYLVREDIPSDKQGDKAPDNAVHELQARVAQLEGELTGLREALSEARNTTAEARDRAIAAEAAVQDARNERDRWQAQAERLATPASPPPGLFARLFGRKVA